MKPSTSDSIFKTINIDHLNHQGIGIAFNDGCAIEVPFSLPQEKIDIEIFHKTKKIQVGRIINIVESHKDRQPPDCIHFGICGGCTLQHCSPEFHDQFKRDRLITYLEQSQVNYCSIDPMITIGPGQRRRIDFLGKKINGEIVLGFHQRLNRRRFNTISCPIIDPKLEKIFEPLRHVLQQIIDDGELIHVFATQADNGIDLLLAGLKRPFSGDQIILLQSLVIPLGLKRLTYKIKTKAHEIYLRDIPYIDIAGFMVEVSPYCFLQACKDSDKILSQCVLDALPADANHIADLFCGRGTLSLPLIKAGYQVDGFECDPHSIMVLNKLIIDNLKTYLRNLFDDPLTSQELEKYDVVVINPPRAGAQAQVNNLPQTKRIKTIVYISCNPETFARDAKILQDGGYHLRKIIPVDQFVWSAHLEVVGVFTR